MKFLFIDFDGVVNHFKEGDCTPTRTSPEGYLIMSDPEKIFMVNNAVDLHDIKVVLSSSWRADPKWRETMKANGFVFEFLDRTPDYHGKTDRGCEIADWLKLSGALDDPNLRYAILDDNGDMHPDQAPHFFQTSVHVGLTQEIMDAVVAHLNA